MNRENRKFYAVVDRNNNVLYRTMAKQVSIFKKKSVAEFLAYEWADESEGLRVIEVNIILNNSYNIINNRLK